MKSIINRNRKNFNFSKSNNYQRRATLNPESTNKIEKIPMNSEISSLYRTNKTLQKYINEKLNSLKSLSKTKKNNEKSFNLKNRTRYSSINNEKAKTKNIKNTKIALNYKKRISLKIQNKKIHKGRNIIKDTLLLKKESKTNKIYSSYNNLPNLLNNNKTNKNKDNNIIKSPIQTKGKLISNFYQNYSSSMSTGISFQNYNDIFKSCSNFLDNNSFKKYNSYDSENENLDKEFIPDINKLKIDSNENRNNNTTNNYEIDSSEDNIIDNKIFFKGGGDGSRITFGNSFSYTNSKKSSSTRRVFKNNENENLENIDKEDENVNFLKSQNESLKKELKESNKQISYLKNQIEKLIKKKKIKNYICSIQIEKCPKPMPYVKRYSKNNSVFEQNNLDINNYLSQQTKKNKNNKNISKYKKK